MAIGLAIALAQALVPMIPNLIQAAENKFGPKKGPDKNSAVVDMSAAFLKNQREKGEYSGPEGINDVMGLVEIVFQVMKATGILKEAGKGDVAGGVGGTGVGTMGMAQNVIIKGTMEPV